MVNPYQAPEAAASAVDPEATARRDAGWALALGIVSLFICAPITAPFALWKASRALRSRHSGMATAAIVVAVFGLLTSLFFWFLAIWQFLTPAHHPQ